MSKVRTEPIRQVVEIIWNDATCISGPQFTQEEIAELELTTVTTVGYLVHEDADKYTLASYIHRTPEWRCSEVSMIPKVNVVSVHKAVADFEDQTPAAFRAASRDGST